MTAGPAPADLAEADIPVFTRPELAVAALGHVARWAKWRARPVGHVVTPIGIDPGRRRAAVGAMLASQPGGGWADPKTAAELLASARRHLYRRFTDIFESNMSGTPYSHDVSAVAGCA